MCRLLSTVCTYLLLAKHQWWSVHVCSPSLLALLQVCGLCEMHSTVLCSTSPLPTVQISPDVTPPARGPRSQQGHGGGNEVASAGEGEYSSVYETVRQIGEGAFGFVAFSRRREDGLMVSGSFMSSVCEHA